MADLDFAKDNTRGASTFLFVVWGAVGLLVTVLAALGAPIITAIFAALMWIGGTLFFGLFALLGNGTYRFRSPAIPVYVVEEPRADGLNDNYGGVPYTQLKGGQIIAEFADGKHTFKNWKKFVDAVGPEN